MRVQSLIVASAFASMAAIAAAGANITIQTVAVGDAGNAADSTGFGAVNYQYSIGKYEVTNAQYTAFLNAKASTDVYGLYNTNMAGSSGGITRSGTSGSYTYSTVSGRENWAVNYVSFWDAARYSNWLQNGQGNGDTETGTYTLTASRITNNTVTRNPGSTWAIASEDEWYKAAYYKGGGLNAGYWLYPTQSDTITTAMANYFNSVGSVTPVGSYAFTSAYGAFDMGGNVWEWNEALEGVYRGARGGAFRGDAAFNPSNSLRATQSNSFQYPETNGDNFGFRVSQIPGPSSIMLLAIAGLGARGRRRA
jgi:formylglycine-generating enzyme required for sulfatase activity